MPVTQLLVPRIQNAIYTLFHPIQTKGADYAHHITTWHSRLQNPNTNPALIEIH